MIFIDALPFRRYCHYMDPDFGLPSRIEVARDVMNLYLDEMKKLKSLLTGNSQRVSLTTDVWTSSQGTNYMCLTAHFIDKLLEQCTLEDDPQKNKFDTSCRLGAGSSNL